MVMNGNKRHILTLLVVFVLGLFHMKK